MKELSIEQKAKRYDEAINIAKSKIKNDKDHILYEEDIIEIFPELKEKTDEEMIQKLIAVIHLYYGEGVDAERDECLEWLEKQRKNKPIERKEFTSIPFGAFDSELIEEMLTIPDGCVATIEGNIIHIKREYKTTTEAIKKEKVDNSNKIEPKFHKDDWVVRKDGKNFCNGSKFAKITKIDRTIYQIDCDRWLYEDEIRRWTLYDAKDGDILSSSNDKAFIYNGNFDSYNVGAYCGLDVLNNFVIADSRCNWTSNCNIKPATEKECKALFDEMTFFNYVWHPETKKLNRLNKDEQNNN